MITVQIKKYITKCQTLNTNNSIGVSIHISIFVFHNEKLQFYTNVAPRQICGLVFVVEFTELNHLDTKKNY